MNANKQARPKLGTLVQTNDGMIAAVTAIEVDGSTGHERAQLNGRFWVDLTECTVVTDPKVEAQEAIRKQYATLEAMYEGFKKESEAAIPTTDAGKALKLAMSWQAIQIRDGLTRLDDYKQAGRFDRWSIFISEHADVPIPPVLDFTPRVANNTSSRVFKLVEIWQGLVEGGIIDAQFSQVGGRDGIMLVINDHTPAGQRIQKLIQQNSRFVQVWGQEPIVNDIEFELESQKCTAIWLTSK